MRRFLSLIVIIHCFIMHGAEKDNVLVVLYNDVVQNDSVVQHTDTLSSLTDSIQNSRQMFLDEILVKGDNITHYADRDVVTITREMRKGARNTAQLLGNIPGFYCDYMNNEIRCLGSTNIIILVDSLEKDASYIKELHHLRYNKIDIVYNPAGKYADYDVLVNLHTKPDYEGYESNLSQQISGVPTDGNGKGKNIERNYSSASFTHTKNKWNFVGRYNFQFTQQEIGDIEKEDNYIINRFSEQYLSPRTSDYYRIHNFYTAIDYQINNKHSVSISYNYSTDASDYYMRTEIQRCNTMDNYNKIDTINKYSFKGINSKRNTLGLYYRGKSGVWNYSYDFNYFNDRWISDNEVIQNVGYSSYNYFSNCTNYIWSKAEVNRRFFNNKFYFSAGYNFTWKDYVQKERNTDNTLSENTYYRNKLWTWLSYRFSFNTDMSFSAAAENIQSEGGNYRDNNMVYKFGGMFFHKWNRQLWMRLNYWCDIKYPELSQVTEHGYFTDSLTWKSGNPTLKTQVFHSTRIWINIFNTFNLQTGYKYSPNVFATIVDVANNELVNNRGPYITYTPQNTEYKEFWTSFDFWKKFDKVSLEANFGYKILEAQYANYKNKNEGFSGFAAIRYYDDNRAWGIRLGYYLDNVYKVYPQSWHTTEIDMLTLQLYKDFFKQRLNISFMYTSPCLFSKSQTTRNEVSDAVISMQKINNAKRTQHGLLLNISYRFHGGKSVRQYNREMQNER